MREILFRGKDVETGKWIDGFYVRLNGKEHRIYDGYAETDCGDYYPDFYKVDPKTVGQFTGLADKNGKRIFEGDIVKITDTIVDFETFAYIEFGNPNGQYNWGWQLVPLQKKPFAVDILHWVDMEESGAFIEVIGNIHDNPELLERVAG